MTVTEERPGSDPWPPKPRSSAPRRTDDDGGAARSPSWKPVAVVAGVALLGLLVWWFAGLRHDVRELRSEVRELSEQVDGLNGAVFSVAPGMSTNATTSLPPDRPPADGETARRLIGDALEVVFTPTMPAAARAAAVIDPGPTVEVLAELSGRPKCAGATVLVGPIRFGDDDHARATVSFDVPDFEVAAGYPFQVDLTRVGGGWKVASSSLDAVISSASGVCSG